MVKSFEGMLWTVHKDYIYEANPIFYHGMPLKIASDRYNIHASQEGLSNDIITKYLEDIKSQIPK